MPSGSQARGGDDAEALPGGAVADRAKPVEQARSLA